MIRSFHPHPATLRRPVLALSIAAALGLLATGAAQAQVTVDVGVNAPAPGWLYDLGAVVSVFIDPPVQQPEPVAVAWAPPPMLVEELPPQPDPYAVWTGGYWTWQGDWVWCAGRWMDPPRQQFVWVQPYYEHRDDRVIFIPGYWSSPDAEFIAPPVERPVAWAYVNEGVVIGPPPEGPVGIFIPPPPGSRPGLIVPAPIGTPPAVIISAPPVMAVGMRVTGNVAIDARHTVNDNRVTNYSVTNVRNVTNVIVQAPAGATASGHAFQAQVPHQAHLAAAMHPQVAARAPVPATRTAVAAYVPGRPAAALPAPQKVQGLPAVPSHGAATVSQAQRAQMGHAPLTPTEARQAHAGHDVDTEHLPPTAAGPQGARPAQPVANPHAADAQRAEQQHAAQEQGQERAQMQAQQRAQQEQQQRAEQQHAAQAQSQQRAQAQEQQRAQQEQVQQRAQVQEQQRAQQEQAQRAEQQRAAQAQAQQRSQVQEQQRAQQEQVQRTEQQHAVQAQAQQRAQQQDQQRAQQEQAQRAEQQHAPQERGEAARPRGEEASRPSH